MDILIDDNRVIAPIQCQTESAEGVIDVTESEEGVLDVTESAEGVIDMKEVHDGTNVTELSTDSRRLQLLIKIYSEIQKKKTNDSN